jgi:hypothetical protein
MPHEGEDGSGVRAVVPAARSTHRAEGAARVVVRREKHGDVRVHRPEVLATNETDVST